MVAGKSMECLLWSIAFPGFGQILNGRFLKAVVFIILEFLVNMNGNINTAIMASFLGNIDKAIQVTNYQWTLFYPCIYTFAIWDAYRDAGGKELPFAYIPAVASAYAGTLGVIFSPVLLGPIWLGLIGMAIGVSVGFVIRSDLVKDDNATRP